MTDTEFGMMPMLCEGGYIVLIRFHCESKQSWDMASVISARISADLSGQNVEPDRLEFIAGRSVSISTDTSRTSEALLLMWYQEPPDKSQLQEFLKASLSSMTGQSGTPDVTIH